MLSLIDSKIIRPASVIAGLQNCVRLKEHDVTATFQELIITHVPADALVCDLDPLRPSSGKRLMGRYSWFLSSGHRIAAKQCDGLINFVWEDREYFFVIEIKSSASGLSKGRLQLESGRAFAHYLCLLLGRDITVCRRLVYSAPPLPATTRGAALTFADFREIPVYCRHGSARISLSQLIGN